jgi:hypothetical protein
VILIKVGFTTCGMHFSYMLSVTFARGLEILRECEGLLLSARLIQALDGAKSDWLRHDERCDSSGSQMRPRLAVKGVY